MSQHYISRNPLEIVVGWDPSLQTFFLQVLDPTKDEEEAIILWLGIQPGELPTVSDLEAALASHAALTSHVVLTPGLRQRLDQEKGNSAQPTALQQWVIEMLFQSKTE